MNNIKISDYPFTIRHLTKEEGGGYLIEFPDLPGCLSDGETIDETIENGQDAILAWMEAARQMKRAIPKPGEVEKQSGKWVQRVPKSIHSRLVNKAKEEGVSLNTLVVTILAESLGGSSYKEIETKPSLVKKSKQTLEHRHK